MEDPRRKFKVRRGFFGQKYLSVRLRNCEITIDDLFPKPCFQLAICTPYNERVEKQKHKRGAGAGEVKKLWYFNCEDEVFKFISQNPILTAMLN